MLTCATFPDGICASSNFRWLLMQGMLSAGAALMGSPAVLGIDIDLDALCIARQNVEEADCCQQVRAILGCMTC